MTPEEKVKAHDGALERDNSKTSGLKSLMLQYLQSAANRKDDTEIESDTDLWSKKILDYVQKCDEGQKEPKPIENRSEELSLSMSISSYLNTASDELYAKGKPFYREDVRKHIHECMKMWQKLHYSYFYKEQESVEAELEELKRLRDLTHETREAYERGIKVGRDEVKSTEWSEEDRERIQRIYDFMWKNRKGDTDTIHQIEKDADWLKALRSQPKRCDTYYDIIHNIFDTLKDIDFMKITPEHRVSLLNDIRVKCKNADECAAILDEPHWKPSEEQMDALETAASSLQSPALESLYNDLKKTNGGLRYDK